MNERLERFLAELKSELITLDEIHNAEFLTEDEKHWINEEYIKWLDMSLKVSRERPFVLSVDPIDTNTTIYTWGTMESNKKFTPIQPHSFMVFAGEQSSGKTAFSFDMALKNASKGIRVLYISLEMTERQILTRIARSHAGITKEKWRDKSLITNEEKISYKAKLEQIENKDNFDVFGFGKGEIPTIDKILEVIESENPQLVFVDNLDLISLSNEKRIEHEQNVSRKIMDFTNDFKIPIVLIHHLKKSKDKTNIDSVRGSGKITDDADAVYICSRRMDVENDLGEEEKARFIVIERKDREFGEGGFHKFYFQGGTFIDNFKGHDPFK